VQDKFLMPGFPQGFADWGGFDELRASADHGENFHGWLAGALLLQ
jgi:hypothetical protein